MLLSFLGTIFMLWVLLLAVLAVVKSDLLRRTWREPYITEGAVLIESDDWGPGAAFHADRLRSVTDILEKHRDSLGRHAVLTANVVLAVPDTSAMRAEGYTGYRRRCLDEGFEEIMAAMRAGIRKGLLVPQLHGIEHCYGEGLLRLAADNDERVRQAFAEDSWWDWESLDSPLQAHYVDGTHLPSNPLPSQARRDCVKAATETFKRLFDMHSLSTVAPCYLWDDEVEKFWADHGICYIQTAGYRCTGRDSQSRYIQDPAVIRTGQHNAFDQCYLVRNAMYEPVDGRDAHSCYHEIVRAHAQGLPAVISTHRYNFTRSAEEHLDSLHGLDVLLRRLEQTNTALRYLSSPELGAWIDDHTAPLHEPGNDRHWPSLTALSGLSRVRAFMLRLWYRHAKLRLVVIATGLIIPLFLMVCVGRDRGCSSA